MTILAVEMMLAGVDWCGLGCFLAVYLQLIKTEIREYNNNVQECHSSSGDIKDKLESGFQALPPNLTGHQSTGPHSDLTQNLGF